MGSEFTFYDYIDADGDGVNVIKNWLNGEGKPAKVRFIMIMHHLEASQPPGFQGSFWKPPYAKLLKNKKGEKWGGFIELRVTGKVQYRLIAKLEKRSVFLIATGIHKDQNWYTDISPQTARLRVVEMTNDPAKYRREHEYN
jgi:hypothetical protein